MIRKVIKYDFKKINKILFILYLITLVLSIINMLFKYGTSDASVATFLLTTDFALIFSFSCLFFAFINTFVRFRESMYKDEAYLTRTLPMELGKLYDAKIIVSVISILIGLLVFGICFIYIFSHTTVTEFIIGTVKVKDNFDQVITVIIDYVFQAILLFLSAINGLILAYKFDKNKDLLTFIFFFIIFFGIEVASYMIFQLLSINDYPVIKIIVDIIIDIILYIIGRLMFKRGVNLE